MVPIPIGFATHRFDRDPVRLVRNRRESNEMQVTFIIAGKFSTMAKGTFEGCEIGRISPE
jgi:hypothetical protein